MKITNRHATRIIKKTAKTQAIIEIINIILLRIIRITTNTPATIRIIINVNDEDA